MWRVGGASTTTRSRRQVTEFIFLGILPILLWRSGCTCGFMFPRAAVRRRMSPRTNTAHNDRFRPGPTTTSSLHVPSRRRPTSSSFASAAEADPAPSMKQYHDLSHGVDRVFCLSDLHTDHVDNLHWLRHRLRPLGNPSSSAAAASSSSTSTTTTNPHTKLNKRDLVIVAGDISHDEEIFAESLDLLLEHCQVLFVPGNHEAWLRSTTSSTTNTTANRSKERYTSSLDKLDYFYRLCRERGAYVDPVHILTPGNKDDDDDDDNQHTGAAHSLWILPLESWYDGTLSFDEELCQGFEYWPWVDFARTRWPFPLEPMDSHNARIPVGLVEYFLNRNLVNILNPWRDLHRQQINSNNNNNNNSTATTVITVSHFAPNQQCLPDWKDLRSKEFRHSWLDHGAGTMSAKFAKVAGTSQLDGQIRSLAPLSSSSSSSVTRQIHVFGHSHRPKDFEFENVRYIHNPLGKPRERQLYMVSPDVDFQCLWSRHEGGEVRGETVLRYWEEHGGGKEMLWKRLDEVRPGRYQQQQQKRGSKKPEQQTQQQRRNKHQR